MTSNEDGLLQGWRMLVEQLSVGRCISLPSNSTGGSKATVYSSGAYARIRNPAELAAGEGVTAMPEGWRQIA